MIAQGNEPGSLQDFFDDVFSNHLFKEVVLVSLPKAIFLARNL